MGIVEESAPDTEVVQKALNDRGNGFADTKPADALRAGQADAEFRRDRPEGNGRRRTRRPGAGDEDVERRVYSALTA
jgi:hypothetical protein